MAVYCNGKKGFCDCPILCDDCDYCDGSGLFNVECVVLCKDCTCKKAVSIGRVMVWRCPYSTVDVELDGFCHRGVKRNEPDRL